MDQREIDRAFQAAARDILGPKASDPRVALIAGELQNVLDPGEVAATELITMRAGGVGGLTSRKLSNLRLDLKKVLDLALNTTLVAAGADSLHLPYPGAWIALQVLNHVCGLVESKLDEQHAAVLWTIWIHRDKRRLTVPRVGLLPLVHGEQTSYGREPMSGEVLEDRLSALERLGAIELTPDVIVIRERVLTRFI